MRTLWFQTSGAELGENEPHLTPRLGRLRGCPWRRDESSVLIRRVSSQSDANWSNLPLDILVHWVLVSKHIFTYKHSIVILLSTDQRSQGLLVSEALVRRPCVWVCSQTQEAGSACDWLAWSSSLTHSSFIRWQFWAPPDLAGAVLEIQTNMLHS